MSNYNSLSRDTAAVADSLSVMMQQEQIYYKSHRNYLDQSFSGDSPAITEFDRVTIVEWCYNIVDKLQLSRETVAQAMEIVDRFLSKPSNYMMLRSDIGFQLVAMTALYSSIKTNERFAIGSDVFASISQGLYSSDEIEAMELIILEGLSWRICAPTSLQMAHHIISLLLPHANIEESTWGFLLDEVGYQTECAVRHCYFSTQLPSTVAMAAILNSLEQVSKEDHRALFQALLLTTSGKFASQDCLLEAKNILQYHVKDDDLDADSTVRYLTPQ